MLSIKKTILFILLISTIVISGCSIGQSAEEKIYEHLEETVHLESGFSDVQKPLVEAEQKEQKLFTEILGLSMKEFERINKLADEATELAKSRQQLIQKEEESINKAYSEFKSIKDLVPELEKDKLKTSANQLMTTMEKRYKAYQDLNKAYDKALDMDLELYALLKKENLSLDELKSFTEKLNQQYEEVLAKQNTFNNLTDLYNEKKEKFYRMADLSTAKDEAS